MAAKSNLKLVRAISTKTLAGLEGRGSTHSPMKKGEDRRQLGTIAGVAQDYTCMPNKFGGMNVTFIGSFGAQSIDGKNRYRANRIFIPEPHQSDVKMAIDRAKAGGANVAAINVSLNVDMVADETSSCGYVFDCQDNNDDGGQSDILARMLDNASGKRGK